MKQKIRQNFGYIEPIIKKEDYFLGQGNLPRIVLEETGNWVDSLPVAEPQVKGAIDSINCTAFKTLDQIEIYEYKAFGERNNYSERWVGIISGTTSKGNDPAKVYDAIREYGLIPEEMLPWSDDIQTLDEYFSFKGADKEACYAEGRRWKDKKDFMHDWVFRAPQPLDEKLNNMKVALRYSPLAFDVSAWEKNADGKYFRFGMSGHWTTCYNIGDFIDVFNSYDPFLKQLVMDFNFFYCKRISITKKIPLTVAQKKSIWSLIVAFLFGEPEELKKLEPVLNPDFVPMKTNTEKLLEALPKWIGTDLSPDNVVDKSVACAEGLSAGLHSLFPDFPKGVVSTLNLKKALDRSPLFKPTLTPKAGVVVVCPRNDTTNGHTGIFLTDDRIVSNDSETGLMQNNYSWPSWIKTFKEGRGLRIYLYKLV